jgi:hypothetical protein
MAEKKYIGKPGKQDDPCWKGYEMVGMKKKGGRQVPNCVPEATDIIAKAKAAVAKKAGAKLKMDPDTGTPDHFTAAMRRKKGLPEETEHNDCGTPECCGQCDTAIEEQDFVDSLNDEMFEGMDNDMPKGLEDRSPRGRARNAMGRAIARKERNLARARKEMNKEEVEGKVYSVHVKGDSKDHNSSEFKKHLKGWGGELHYASDKGAAYKFKKEYQATGFHHGVKSGFKSLDSEHDGQVKEELGKSNEWGTDALRKKYAAMTPGQESMAADKIPSFDPRYDNVTTQYCGGIREGYLAEISAKGAEARAKFQTKVRQTLADPANIKRAKKTLAKRKEAEKAKEPAHLVMQLRKAVSIGSKVHFQDGSHHAITGNHADIFMSKYNSAKSSIEKEALQKRAHKSHSEFMRTIAEEAHENCGTPDCCQMCDTAEMGTHHVDSYEAHRGSGDQISPVISHDDEDIRFQDFDEEAFEKELEADVLALSWDDMVDLYDEDEIEYDESPDEEGEELEEGITPAGRLKKKFNAMRTKSRRMMARNIAIKRVSSPEKLKSRSIRAARRMVYKRLLRNRDISSVSSSEKTRLEAQIKRMAPMVARLSVRVMPAVRKLEQSRIKNSRTKKRK